MSLPFLGKFQWAKRVKDAAMQDVDGQPNWSRVMILCDTTSHTATGHPAAYVIQPSEDQASACDTMEIPDLVQALIDGYNVNFLANGQTGSGKTHTVFGPPTIDWASSASAPDYGFLPRAALLIHERLQEMEATTGDTHVLTGAMLETGYAYLFDLLDNKKICYLDQDHEVVGAQQVSLDSPSAILSFIARVEDRSTKATGMNDTSSRTHCVVQLRLWRHNKKTGKVRSSTLNVLDLAGAERLSEAHEMYMDLGNATAAQKKSILEGMFNNFTLHTFDRLVLQIHDNMRRKRDPGAGVQFRVCCLTRVLRGSLCPDNAAITSMVVPVSQNPANWRPTKDALALGERISMLRMKPKRQRAVPLDRLVSQLERSLSEAKATLKRMKSSAMCAGGKTYKYTGIREGEIRSGYPLLELLKGLSES
ncbi:kinesin-like protein KIFC3 [Kipferlia bialata]|uniref:Kinesin-like protein KIFC3 n=1 Tax=Kipferlia bialata TaxID=797122 RepID=A0A9K3CUM1_9EUKA|nr:kinesin-like protein KIFC3 [Kipferlia bialata]|eukprot:g2931.t1